MSYVTYNSVCISVRDFASRQCFALHYDDNDFPCLQSSADRVAQNLEIISKDFQFSTRMSSRFFFFLLIFAKYLSRYLHIFTCTYRGTHTRAHMYNQHTRGTATTRHRSLVERDRRKALLETLHTPKKPKTSVRKNRHPRI